MQRRLFASFLNDDLGPPSSVAGACQGLNQAQLEAVTTVEGPVLVIAGAGTGKTRTLVHRLAYLVEQGYSPEEILLLTFTRKAAQEMVSRAAMLLDDSLSRVMGGTFHAVANLLLRRYAPLLGYPSSFTIIDQADAEGIVNLLRAALKAPKRFPTKRVIVSILSKAVNKQVPVADLVETEYPHLVEFVDDILKIGDQYRQFKRDHHLMDYDDLLLNWHRLLAEHGEVREELARRFTFLMVDEYQDTNPVQAQIVRLMAAPGNNVMAVGDDAQSIYSFRGADFRNIMDFPHLFPGTRIIRLEENYRSTQPILELTNAIIREAAEKYSKNLFSKNPSDHKPVVFSARDEAEEARFVADRIAELTAGGLNLDQVAVLFRSGYHSFKLELELGRRGVGFEKRGGLKLTESAHVKDVLSYLRLLVNPKDRLSLSRVLLQVDRVGPKTAEGIVNQAQAAGDLVEALRGFPAPNPARPGLAALADLFEQLRESSPVPRLLLEQVMEFYQPLMERLYPDDYPKRARDLEQLSQIIAGYEELGPFLDDATLDPPQADEIAPHPERLILSTIHSAKGLEWDTVFIIHLAEGRFPAGQALSPEEYEEERRLLYVAATRAKKRLYLIYPRRLSNAQWMHGASGGPSPFLAEIPQELYTPYDFGVGGDRHGHPGAPADVEGTRQVSGLSQLAVGDRVRHPFFGVGQVESKVEPSSVVVSFPGHGRKTLHLDYARLEVVE